MGLSTGKKSGVVSRRGEAFLPYGDHAPAGSQPGTEWRTEAGFHEQSPTDRDRIQNRTPAPIFRRKSRKHTA